MATAQFNFDRDVRPLAIRAAKKVFKRRWDVAEMVDDVVHEAWIGWDAYPHGPPHCHAKFAVRRVKCGRHFRQSARSYEGPNLLRNVKPQRETEPFFPMDVLANAGDDPAEIGGFAVDFAAWLETLTPRKRAIVHAVVCGVSGLELAKEFGLSPGRISQIRRELFTDWVARHG